MYCINTPPLHYIKHRAREPSSGSLFKVFYHYRLRHEPSLSEAKRCRTKPIMASKKDKAQKSLTKEEELLLQDFSRNVSTKSSALFYGNALIVSAIPICKCATSSKILIKIYVQIVGLYVNRLCWNF